MTYLRNGWYCAGWGRQLGHKPQQRLFLGEPIVLFRRSSGVVVALGDRCPHRFAPLHEGRVHGDRIACPYHGLQFGADGRCQHNPHGDGKIPQAAAVRAYPIVEQQGALWIWMGEPALADPARILDISLFDRPAEYTTVVGHMLVRGHYQLVIDNLLDLTHAAYLHVDTLGAPPEQMLAPDRFKFEFREEAQMVEASYLFRGMPTAPQMQPFWPAPSGDARGVMRWHAPSSLSLAVSIDDPAHPEAGQYLQPSLHLLVPQDAQHTHYFFAVARNRYLDSAEHSALIERDMRRAFEQEDEPMIQACQQLMGTPALFDLKPVLLPTDVAAVRARRLLDQLIAQEQRQSQA